MRLDCELPEGKMHDREIGRYDYYEKQHSDLLHSLKESVTWLVSKGISGAQDADGCLSNVCSIIDKILAHGLYYQGPEKYWNVISVLRVLTPEVAPPILASEISGKKDVNDVCSQTLVWLRESLVEHSLSRQIRALTQDSSHLKDYYKECALLRHPSCVNGLLKCLYALEQNQPVILENSHTYLSLSVSAESAMVETPVQTSSLEFCDSKNRFVPFYPCSTGENTGLEAKQNLSGSDNADHFMTCSDSSPVRTVYQRGSSKPSPKRVQHRYARRNQRLKEANKCERTDEAGSSTGSECCDRNYAKNSFIRGKLPTIRKPSLKNGLYQPKVKHHVSCPELQLNMHSAVRKVKSLPDLHILYFMKSPSLHKSNSWYKVATCDLMEHASESNCDNLKQLGPLRSESERRSSESSDTFVNKSVDSAWKAQHLRSKSDGSGMVEAKSGATNSSSFSVEDPLSSSLPSILLEKEQKRKSIFEGGSVVVPTECFFPRPQPGQTLMSFLSTDFNICAELDRENAHFCISEALISAIEQIKCTETLKFAAEEAESDEEIQKLTQRIRIRRRERLQEKAARTAIHLSDGRTDTTTTSQSASPMSTSHSSEFDACDSVGSDDEDVADLDLSDRNASNLTSMKESGLSLSLASMYSDADIHKGPFHAQSQDISDKSKSDDQSGMQLSAEVVALSLLKRFSEKQLPKASDLEWLVSEQDAPQRLLPLPDSWPVSPDVIEEDYDLEKTRLRGNFEWAPPRQQIIFIIHQKPIKKDAVLKQDYRCAGCGMKIEKSYVKKFRYCEYLGKFFCQCCHANNLAYIPGRILWKWDFGQYYVSKFSWKLLDQMFHDPIFNVNDINPKQYRKIRQLGLCRDYRIQLFYLKDFIRTCRDSKLILKDIDQLPEHICKEPHLYSISDFLKVKSGEMSKQLSNLVTKCTSHVMQCILCQGKGFICETCNKSDDIIFPFQLSKVCHCTVCGCCFHKRCFKDGSCSKCARIKERKRKLLEQKEQLYSDEEL